MRRTGIVKLLERGGERLPLARLFDTASSKVLDLLLANGGLEYTKDEISGLAAVPDRTLRRILRLLLAERIVKRRRAGGRAYHYAADVSSLRVSGLLDYVNATMILNLDHAVAGNDPGRRCKAGPRDAPG